MSWTSCWWREWKQARSNNWCIPSTAANAIRLYDQLEHQVRGQHLEVQVAEERHGGHSGAQLVDEVGSPRAAGCVAQRHVKEHGCGAQSGPHGMVKRSSLVRRL
ncbi:hypothetical protein ACIRU5_19375 [Streptomyces misionensis]|uniref:hypothetical protein n=1 Tax=Streptomyces misionensis TaxID=67331 RepID=UPI0037FAA4DD